MADPAPPSPENNAYLAAIDDVNSTISFMTGMAQEFSTDAQGVLDALKAWTPPQEGTPPDIRPTPIQAKALPTLPKPNPNLFGEVGDLDYPGMEDLTGLVKDFDLDDPGAFNPKIRLVPLPDPPPPIDTSGQPTRPVLGTVDLPADPDLPLPAVDALDAIAIPPLPVIVIPPFNVDDVPLFDTDPPSLKLNWTEQPYTPLVANELTTTIKAMLAGGFAMPAGVLDALFSAARDREDMTARAAVEDAYDDWAARGFSMPPGMLVEQVNTVREKNQLQVNSLSRDVLAKAAQWEIDNLRAAVAQGVALEGVWTSHWNNIAQRAFEAARLAVDLLKDQFNLAAQAFNLKIARISAQRDVFEARLRAELAKLEILKSEVEIEQLKGTLNEQKVRIYTAKLEGIKTLAQVFETKLRGAEIKYNITVRGPIDLYKTDVEAWGENLKAQKTRFEAFDSLARGAEATAKGYEAEARAYEATVRAAADRNNARARVVDAKLHAVEIATQKFLGVLQANLGKITAKRDAIAARAQAWGADTAFYGEQLKFTAQGEQNRVQALEATVRNNMAYFETVSRQYDARQQRLLQAALAIKDAIAAAGHIVAQITAGAFSALHMSAHVQGSGSDAFNHNYSYNMTPTAPPTE